jgi:hypothetical protein
MADEEDTKPVKVDFDLNAARKARSGVAPKPKKVRLDGNVYVLVGDPPLEAIEHIDRGRFTAAFGLLAADPDGPPLPLAKITVDDMKQMLGDLYGLGPTS